MDTMHYKNDKTVRIMVIEKYIGFGRDIFSAEVNRGHKNGTEIHVVTDTAIIKIYNARTRRHVTDLIARPNQIKRVYNAKGQYAPKWLLDVAYENQNRGFNMV